MVRLLIAVFCFAMLCSVLCKPLENNHEDLSGAVVESSSSSVHNIQKRFINPGFTSEVFQESTHTKMRTKRSSEEDCEKLSLCKLHARSNRNFFAAFQLYFVNKENARLWDHRAHSLADCQRRFSGCYE